MEYYKDFYYNGKYASSLGVIAIRPTKDSGDFSLKRDLMQTEFSSYRNTVDIYDTKYNKPLTLSFFIIKDPCNNNSQAEMAFQKEDIRELNAWLTSTHTAKKLELFSDMNIGYYGVFTDIEPYIYGDLFGVNATFTANAPFGFILNKEIINIEDDNEIEKTLVNISDELEDFVYPTITLTHNVVGDYSIQNMSDGENIFAFHLSEAYEKVVIDCHRQFIIADDKPLTLTDIGWEVNELFDWNNVGTNVYKLYWLKLCYGRNKLKIKGQGNYVIKYNSPVKIGGY